MPAVFEIHFPRFKKSLCYWNYLLCHFIFYTLHNFSVLPFVLVPFRHYQGITGLEVKSVSTTTTTNNNNKTTNFIITIITETVNKFIF